MKRGIHITAFLAAATGMPALASICQASRWLPDPPPIPAGIPAATGMPALASICQASRWLPDPPPIPAYPRPSASPATRATMSSFSPISASISSLSTCRASTWKLFFGMTFGRPSRPK